LPTDDTSTLTIGPLDTLTGTSSRLPLVPALTIVWHPDVDRVGQTAPLAALIERDEVAINRNEPSFFTPGSSDGQPVDHRAMSQRETALFIGSKAGFYELRPGTDDVPVEVDGEPLRESRRISAEDFRRGLIILARRRFVFCFHGIRFPVTRSPAFGLLGAGDGIEEVRRSISKIAAKKVPVLVRGESGTGKELVARALHEVGQRADAPFVAVNMALLRPERAAAELFGYEKGSFTGATEGRPGLFRSAHGGTLFLDEIGLTPPDVQPMLLRVLEDQVVQPLGSSQARKVDVRIVAATDARLEEAMEAGRFQSSLYHRLNSSLNIRLPALRDRKEDIGFLFAQFLRSELGGSSAFQRVFDPYPATRAWLSARDVAALALYPWPGNVRELKGLASELVVKAGDSEQGDTRAIIGGFLRRSRHLPPVDPGMTAPSSGPKVVPAGVSPADIDEALVLALQAADWNRPQAAKALGISTATFWRRLQKYPDLRRVADLRRSDIERELSDASDDVDLAATRLGVPTDLLARRLGITR
jgi:two-component system, NtrC family, nitrogen regulation response regulator GlnG